jgi:DNA (cytosine-5)-methyltransferase 1
MINLIRQQKYALQGYTFIDLFCGIGGFHLALKSFGAECVFASDINAKAQNIYQTNFVMRPQGDITKIKANQIPAHDILCAGFPCQAFSISGGQAGFDHPGGKLFYEIVRIAKYHNPQLILLENVANLEKHDKGKTITVINNKLQQIGYTPSYRVLNAADFNVPQSRRRIYIVAFRNDIYDQVFEFPTTIPLTRHLVDMLDNDKKAIAIAKVHRKYYIRKGRTEIEKKKGHYLRIGEIGQGRQGERIYSAKGCSVTISATGGGLGGRTGMYLINRIVRKLTPRECARLMGFPDNFNLANTENQAYQQLGNSVVVDVLQRIIIKIIPHL